MIELKSCPFCGGEARLFVNNGVRVLCNKCHASSEILAAEKAFIADLTANKLEMKDGTLTGFDDYCKKQQESDPAAFQSEKPAPTFANPIQNPAPHTVSAAGLAAQRYSAQFAPNGKE